MRSIHVTGDTANLESLIDLLIQEEAIYRELLAVLDAEHAAMLAMEIARLTDLASRKETLGLRIRGLDESRKVLARRLTHQLGLAPDEVTITRLCELAPVGVAERLAAAGRRLRETVEACQVRNAENARAAHRGLDLVQSAIGHLIDAADPAGKVYQTQRSGPGGYATISRTSGSGLISRRA